MQKSQNLFLLLLIIILPLILISGCGNNNSAIEENNMAIIKYVYEEGVNKQNPEIWNEILTEDYVRHCQAMPPEFREIHGIDAMIAFLNENFATFPDWNEKIDNLFADGEMVAYTSYGTGTHLGKMGDIPPTGKKAECMMVIMHRFKNGKIAETWITWDNLAFLEQLGLFPPPAES